MALLSLVHANIRGVLGQEGRGGREGEKREREEKEKRKGGRLIQCQIQLPVNSCTSCL